LTTDRVGYSLDDTGVDIFPSAAAIQMLIGGALGGLQGRGGVIAAPWPGPGLPPQIQAIYKTAAGVIVGIRSRTFSW